MKNIRNLVFYTLIIGAFSGLMYFLIQKGQVLEINKVTITQDPPSTSSWFQFIDTYKQNITSPLAILLLQIITIILVARAFGYICKKNQTAHRYRRNRGWNFPRAILYRHVLS